MKARRACACTDLARTYIECMGELVDVDHLVGLPDLAKKLSYNAEHLRQVAVAGKLRAVFVGGVWISTRRVRCVLEKLGWDAPTPA